MMGEGVRGREKRTAYRCGFSHCLLPSLPPLAWLYHLLYEPQTHKSRKTASYTGKTAIKVIPMFTIIKLKESPKTGLKLLPVILLTNNLLVPSKGEFNISPIY